MRFFAEFVVFIISVVLLDCKVVQALKIVRLEVPSVVRSGQPVILSCLYELQNDQIYSVKWYKDNIEIYSFLPNEENKQKTYNNTLGVFIDAHRSNVTHVYFNTTDHHSRGKYRCEVSAESPSFQTERAQKDMLVYVQPRERPSITGILPSYEVGSYVSAWCNYGPSRPNVTLEWFINGHKVAEFDNGSYAYNDSLFSFMTRLHYLTTREDFQRDGTMDITCKASANLPYNVTSNEIIVRKLDRKIETSGPTSEELLVRTSSPTYSSGQKIDFDCEYRGTATTAHLQWFVNDKEAHVHSSGILKALQRTDGKARNVLSLSFAPDEQHFIKNELHLKCISGHIHQIQSSAVKTVTVNLQGISQLQVSESRSNSNNSSAVHHLTPFFWLVWSVACLTLPLLT